MLDNAAEALNGKGNIIVSLNETSEGTVVFSVEDDGCGIPDHLFHAKEEVLKHGGFFKIISKENQGTNVNLTLPLS